MVRMPPGGNQPSATENSTMSMSPNQNVGTEIPNSASRVTPWSVAEYGRAAEITPAGTATASVSASAAADSTSVLGSIWPMISSTGTPAW